jgi:hypothetical protein
MNRRIVFASTIAPPVGVVVLAAALAFLWRGSPHNSWQDWFGEHGGNFYLLLFFGSPVGYAVELFVGVPAYRWMVRTGRLRFIWVVAAAILGGVIAVGLPANVIAYPSFPTLMDEAGSVLVGALSGFVAGLAFWWTAFAEIHARRAA